MKIAVNTQLLLKNKLEGIGWFAYETLKRITQQHPEHHFLFIFDREYSEEFIFSENITPIVVGPQSRHPLLWYMRFEYLIPSLIKNYGADLFLSPDGWSTTKTDMKKLVVLHDLSFEHYPDAVSFANRIYLKHFFPRYASGATRIATVSEFSKKDISEKYKIDASKIDVVYNGASKIYSPVSEDEKQKTKKEFTAGADYFICVGSMHPRKNIARLLQAFDEMKKTSANKLKLVLVGEKYWWTKEMEYAYNNMQNKSEVIFIGRLSQEKLKAILGSALAMVYPSYFEGFGIPLIEAMQCDIPVITSNVSSMPEIAKDAALFIDPFSVDSIKEALLKIANENTLRNSLIAKGRIIRENYSWDKTATLLWSSVEKCFQ